jgi:hypothetical protein
MYGAGLLMREPRFPKEEARVGLGENYKLTKGFLMNKSGQHLRGIMKMPQK